MESLTTIMVPAPETAPKELPDPMGTDLALFSDSKLAVQTGLLVLAVLTVAYVASDVIMPMVLAVILNLMLQPAMRLLRRAYIPKALAAFLLICGLFSTVIAFGAAISSPAERWAAKLPDDVTKIYQRLRFLSHPFGVMRKFLHQMDTMGQGGQGAGGGLAALGGDYSDMLFKGTQHFASGLFETILILFFLLISGNMFLRRLVEIMPRFKEKRQLVDLSQQIEKNVSAYLVTITLMNIAVGIATGLTAWICGLGDAVFWGVLGFLLNFLPILGACIGIAMLLIAGLVAFQPLWHALLPALIYFIIHVVEGETVTPLLLARRFTLNPVLVILSLILWFWMWGVPGAILAVPMLAITKLVCDGIRKLNAIGHFLGGDA